MLGQKQPDEIKQGRMESPLLSFRKVSGSAIGETWLRNTHSFGQSFHMYLLGLLLEDAVRILGGSQI